MELQKVGDDYAATVCNYSSMVASKGADGQYGGTGSNSGQVATLTFGPDPKLTPDAQRTPVAQQIGPEPKPADNVFGTWITTDWHGLKSGDPRCTKLAPGTPADVPEIYIRHDPPPTLPPDPGWPEGGSA